MQQVTVTESAIRALIREALSSRSPETFKSPVKTSNVVDPSASLTDPGNSDYRPDSFEELKVAFNSLSEDIPQEKIPSVYKKIVSVIQNLDDKKEDKKLMKRKDTKVESFIRSKIRRMILENRNLLEALPGAQRQGGRRKKVVGDPKKDYLSGDAVEMGLSDIASALGKSIGGVHRDIHTGREKFVSNAWLYSVPPAGMAMFKKSGIEFLNRLEKEALRQWDADPLKDTGETLIKSEDVPLLLSNEQVKDAIDLFLEKWLTDPENFESPDDMLSPEDLMQFRQNPEAVVTLPSFFCTFLLDFLRENYEVLDSLRTFADSKEYKSVLNDLKKKYKSDASDTRRGIRDVLANIAPRE